jgi:hypothetical protein
MGLPQLMDGRHILLTPLTFFLALLKTKPKNVVLLQKTKKNNRQVLFTSLNLEINLEQIF